MRRFTEYFAPKPITVEEHEPTEPVYIQEYGDRQVYIPESGDVVLLPRLETPRTRSKREKREAQLDQPIKISDRYYAVTASTLLGLQGSNQEETLQHDQPLYDQTPLKSLFQELAVNVSNNQVLIEILEKGKIRLKRDYPSKSEQEPWKNAENLEIWQLVGLFAIAMCKLHVFNRPQKITTGGPGRNARTYDTQSVYPGRVKQLVIDREWQAIEVLLEAISDELDWDNVQGYRDKNNAKNNLYLPPKEARILGREIIPQLPRLCMLYIMYISDDLSNYSVLGFLHDNRYPTVPSFPSWLLWFIDKYGQNERGSFIDADAKRLHGFNSTQYWSAQFKTGMRARKSQKG